MELMGRKFSMSNFERIGLYELGLSSRGINSEMMLKLKASSKYLHYYSGHNNS